MDVRVEVPELKGLAARADVPFLVEPASERPTPLLMIGDIGEQGADSNVKFAFVHEKWLFDVALD